MHTTLGKKGAKDDEMVATDATDVHPWVAGVGRVRGRGSAGWWVRELVSSGFPETFNNGVVKRDPPSPYLAGQKTLLNAALKSAYEGASPVQVLQGVEQKALALMAQ